MKDTFNTGLFRLTFEFLGDPGGGAGGGGIKGEHWLLLKGNNGWVTCRSIKRLCNRVMYYTYNLSM